MFKQSLKPYEKYKDSGVEWLGEIPAHWEIKRGKLIFISRKELNSKLQCKDRLALTLNGVINRGENDSIGLNPSDFRTYQIFNSDELVFKLIDLENVNTSRVGYVHKKGIMSSAYIRLIKHTEIYTKYFYYQYYDLYLRRIFNYLGKGVRETLSPNDLLNILIIVPPLETQNRIVEYLNLKTQQAEIFIEKQTRLVELLKEQKKAIINKAVTKGLNPDAPMKDSGIEWLGEIPAHWEVKPTKYIFQERSDKSTDGKGTLLMMSQEYGLVKRADYHEKGEVAESTIGHKITKFNDLVFNKLKAHLGVFFRNTNEAIGLVSSDYSVYYSKQNISVKYYELLYRHPIFISMFIKKATGIVDGFIRLYTSNFFSIKSLYPPISEQQQIVSHIESKTAKIDQAIEKAEKEISLVKEYLQSLIYQVVTGRLEIDNEQRK